MGIRHLTASQFESEARPAFERVFKCTEWTCKEPFQDGVEERVILDTKDYFDLDEGQHEALCKAAASEGDEYLLFSVLCCFNNASMAQHTWQVSLFDYHGLYDETLGDIPHEDGGIPLHRVVYSSTGRWGVWMPELYALLGGTGEFVECFRREYPSEKEDLHKFTDRFRRAAEKRNVDVSWVQPMLNHVYGANSPKF